MKRLSYKEEDRCLKVKNPEKIPVESVTDNYGRTVLCTECGNKM